jgi:hypothetical protein
VIHTKEWACPHKRLGKDIHQTEHRSDLTIECKGERNLCNQSGSVFKIGHGQRVLYRFDG